MTNSLASRLRERLEMPAVAAFYGFHPNAAGFIQCPFHAGDHHGSLKLYSGGKSGFHCFGCGAHGSVIDFVMRLYDLDFRQACLRLNVDFGLGLVGERPTAQQRSLALEQRRLEEGRKQAEEAEYRRMAAEHRYYHQIKTHFAPLPGEHQLHPLFAEALVKLPHLEAWLDEH